VVCFFTWHKVLKSHFYPSVFSLFSPLAKTRKRLIRLHFSILFSEKTIAFFRGEGYTEKQSGAKWSKIDKKWVKVEER